MAGWALAMIPTLAQTNALSVARATNTSLVASAGPIIHFAGTDVDFGKVRTGEVVKHTFVFTNAGAAMLEIKDVRPSCGCTTTGRWDRQVAPGRTGSIPLQFNSAGFQGEVGKVVDVLCNDPAQSNVTLRLKATVWNAVDVIPGNVVFNVSASSEARETRVVRIVNNLEKPIELSDLQSTNRAFQGELKTVRSGREFELHLTAVPPFNSSPLFGGVTLKTSAAEMPGLYVAAYLIAKQAVTVSPDPIRLPAGPLTGVMSITVSVRNNETNALVLSDAGINLPGATVRLQESQPGRIYSLMLTLPVGFEAKPDQRVELSVKSNHPRFPLIKVPVLGPTPTRLPPGIGR
jgi:hypothetical protein